jgi:hypothetical protein
MLDRLDIDRPLLFKEKMTTLWIENGSNASTSPILNETSRVSVRDERRVNLKKLLETKKLERKLINVA